MGARMLRNWLSQPLAAVEPIRRRQEAVQTFIENSAGLDNFRAQLSQVRDLERTIGRLSTGSGNARDLVALRLALEQIPAVKGILASRWSEALRASSRTADAGCRPTAREERRAPRQLACGLEIPTHRDRPTWWSWFPAPSWTIRRWR